MSQITLIALPYDSGRLDERMGRGPGYLLESGLADHLRAQQHDVEVRIVRLSETFHSEGQGLVALQNLATPIVRDAIAGERRVLLLSGNCGPAAVSAIAALDAETTGVVWFDAHADFNTPETSASGFLDGMALAILTGRCWPALAARFAGFAPLPERNVVLVGTRNLDSLETAALNQSAITTIAPSKMDAFAGAVEALSARVENIYVHFDVDVLDKSEGSANSYASSGGLSAQALCHALELLNQSCRIRVASITSYDPACDGGGRVRSIIERAAVTLTADSPPLNCVRPTGSQGAGHSVCFFGATYFVLLMTSLRTSLFALLAFISSSAFAGNLKVNLAPTQAVSAGAQWRVDGGVWRASGVTVKNLSNATHPIEYKAVAGWIAPAPTSVALTNNVTTTVTGTYSLPASLVVTLNPSTAQWRVDSGAWQNSGVTASGLTPGAHSIAYSAVANQLSPQTETVTLVSGQTMSLTRTYTPAGQIYVTLTPTTAQWRVDGGAWRATNTSSGLIPTGSHTVEYSPVATYITPPPQTVALNAGQTFNLSQNYQRESALIVNLTPAVGQWRADGGPWQNSGARVVLVPGSHAVEYSAATGYTAPPSENVFVSSGGDTTVTRSYLRPGSLTVNVVPTEGQWRLTGGAWQASGTTITGLRPGNYGVELASVPGWFDAPTYGITVTENANTTATYSHLRHATITVTLTPATGQWRLNGGAWQPSGATVGALYAGNYTLSYSTVSGYTTPATETLALASQEQKSITRTYAGASSLTVTLSPPTGSWNVDGGPWRNSGSTATALAPGSHALSYKTIANNLTPSAETVTLGLDENASIARSYTPAGEVYVTLVPGAAQWRVDGGAWSATNTSSGLIAAGSHMIEYSPLENYIAPPMETVTVTAAQTLTISKTYTANFGASLEVTTVPAYLSQAGVVQWRLDGGNWNGAGAPVSVSPGTYTLEFQPVAGLEAPAPVSVTLTQGEAKALEATFHMTHRLRFFLHSDVVAGLSTPDLQSRLSQYAAHLQTVWHRESLRRLTFNPATDITIVSGSPFSNNAFPPIAEFGFELWAYADLSPTVASYGGNVAIDVSHAGGADNMHWTQIYDPASLAPGSSELNDYSKQLSALIHECEHVFGAGFGEYYSASGFDDLTGVAPIYSVDYFTPEDPFWNAHPDFWSDPLLRNVWNNYRIGDPNTLPAVLDAVHFSTTSRGIIDGCYRNAAFASSARTTLPDVTHVRVRVVDSSTGQPIPGATLRIWNRPAPVPTGMEERPVLPTSIAGVFEFDWNNGSPASPLSNADNGKLLKAFAAGYQSKVQWEWIYDAQRVKTVDNSDVWEITVALDPAP